MLYNIIGYLLRRNRTVKVCKRIYLYSAKAKKKLSLYQAVNAHTFVRIRGSHIFSRQSAHR
jgi:hypothetical protein